MAGVRGSVWLFLPNIIGYVRMATILGAALCGSDPARTPAFFALYAVSYLLDAFDGPAARYLNQTSRFGAVLDMVTDRVSTALLLCLLAHEASAGQRHADAALWLVLMMLDVGAHWVQMFSAGLAGAASHKELKDEPALLTWYYRRTNLFVVCLLNETHLVMALMLARKEQALRGGIPLLGLPLPWGVPWGLEGESDPLIRSSLAAWLWALTAAVCVLKQGISLLHLVRASQRVVSLDTQECSASTSSKGSASGKKASRSVSARRK